MNVLLIGYGSIGKRHERVIKSLNVNVDIVSKYKPDAYRQLVDVENFDKYEYVVVANATSEHYSTLKQLEKLGYRGIVLVEKPLYHRIETDDFAFEEIYVAYNLRFHPCIQYIKNLNLQDVVSIQAYVGQYLPTWRPRTDYRTSYSASRKQGGGVLRDLSHELDYLLYLFGSWKELVAIQGKYSNLEIDSDDHVGIMYATANTPLIQVQLNYVDHHIQRKIILNTNESTYVIDLIQQMIFKDGQVEFKSDIGPDDTYYLQHKHMLNNDSSILCSFSEGVEVMKMIQAIEQSSMERSWITCQDFV